MTDKIKILGRNLNETIELQLDLLKLYEPQEKQKDLPPSWNFCFFDDKSFPLTKYALEQYSKRLEIIKNSRSFYKLPFSKLAQHLGDTSKQRNFDKMEHNPDGKLVFTNDDGRIKKLSYRDWWIIGAADAIRNMVYQCAVYIYWLQKNPSATQNQRAKQINKITPFWNQYFVEFSQCWMQIESSARKVPGKKTAQKIKEIKDWALMRAHEIHEKNTIIKKYAIAQKLTTEYKQKNWKVPLKDFSEQQTIYNWLRLDKSF